LKVRKVKNYEIKFKKLKIKNYFYGKLKKLWNEAKSMLCLLIFKKVKWVKDLYLYYK